MAERAGVKKQSGKNEVVDLRTLSIQCAQAVTAGFSEEVSVGVVHQNQEFSIQNEDFPASPGFKGGNTDFPVDSHQKEQLHDSVVSMMQSQHFPMGRSGGFNLGVPFSSRLQQQQQHASSIGSGGLPSIGLRPMNSSNTISGVRPYDQLIPPPLNNTVSKLQAWFQWNAL